MVRLEASFFEYLGDEKFCDRARRILIETEPYFLPAERAALYSMLKITPAVPKVREYEEIYRTNIDGLVKSPIYLFLSFPCRRESSILE